MVLCLVRHSFENFDWKKLGKNRGKMVRTTFSKNVAICCSLFLIYHTASGPRILKHYVIACFQYDKYNP